MGGRILTILLLASFGCHSAVPPDARHLSVLAVANADKLDGTHWDNGGGEFLPIWGNLMLPSIFSTSNYPDLMLTVVAANGEVSEYSSGVTRYGTIESDCPDRLACRWEIEVPSAAYALLITDVDPAPNPNMSLAFIKAEIARLVGSLVDRLTGPPTNIGPLSASGTPAVVEELPLSTSRQFVMGALFPGPDGSDEEAFYELESKAREWLAAAHTTFLPRVGLWRKVRDGCRSEECGPDVEGFAGTLKIEVIDPPHEKAGSD